MTFWGASLGWQELQATPLSRLHPVLSPQLSGPPGASQREGCSQQRLRRLPVSTLQRPLKGTVMSKGPGTGSHARDRAGSQSPTAPRLRTAKKVSRKSKSCCCSLGCRLSGPPFSDKPSLASSTFRVPQGQERHLLPPSPATTVDCLWSGPRGPWPAF